MKKYIAVLLLVISTYPAFSQVVLLEPTKDAPINRKFSNWIDFASTFSIASSIKREAIIKSYAGKKLDWAVPVEDTYRSSDGKYYVVGASPYSMEYDLLAFYFANPGSTKSSWSDFKILKTEIEVSKDVAEKLNIGEYFFVTGMIVGFDYGQIAGNIFFDIKIIQK